MKLPDFNELMLWLILIPIGLLVASICIKMVLMMWGVI